MVISAHRLAQPCYILSTNLDPYVGAVKTTNYINRALLQRLKIRTVSQSRSTRQLKPTLLRRPILLR
jgi:hypothetical protein